MSGTVFVVTSGKGGVGKTTTALNLGVALRRDGASVALVDADLGMANLAPMLGVDGDVTLHDVLAGTASPEEAIVEETEGFGVVPGGRDLESFAAIDPGKFPAVVEAVAAEYDFVVVDAGPGLHYESVLPLEVADEVVPVTTPAETAVGDTEKVADVAAMMGATVRGAVLNRATDETDPDAIAAALDLEVLGVVPEDPVVAESTDAGVPIERRAPDSSAAVAYRRLADALVGTDPTARGGADDAGDLARNDTAGAGSDATVDGEEESDGETGLFARLRGLFS